MTRPAPSPAATSRRRIAGSAALTLGLNLALLVALAPAGRGWPHYLLPSIALWLCWAVALPDLAGPGRRAPILVVIAGWYFVEYVLPGFSNRIRPLDGRSLDEPSLRSAGQVLALGLGALALGARTRLTRGHLLDRAAAAMGDLQRIRWLLLAAGLLALPVRLAYHDMMLHQVRGEAKPFQWLGIFFPLTGNLPLVALGGLFVLHLRRQLSRTLTIAFLAFAAFVLFTDLSTGLLAQVWASGLVLVFLFRMVRGRLPVAWLVAGALVAAPLTIVKSQFRQDTWAEADLSLVDRAAAFVTLASRASPSGADAGGALETVAMRFNYLGVLARTMQLTPEPIPYWDGYTYERILWLGVPRVLYPDKPVVEVGQEYGHRYGLLESDDFITSFNLSQLVELFANFGVVGVALGMFLLGALTTSASTELDRPGMSDACRMAFAPALVWITNIESDFTTVWGAVLYMIPFHVVLVVGLQRLADVLPVRRAVARALPRAVIE